jgi:hypothetical protein
MNTRMKKTKRPTSRVVVESPPLIAESIDGSEGLTKSPAKNGLKNAKATIAGHDRGRLRSIEIFLNNCLNLANAIESKQAAKVVQLLRDARDEAIRLRG